MLHWRQLGPGGTTAEGLQAAVPQAVEEEAACRVQMRSSSVRGEAAADWANDQDSQRLRHELAEAHEALASAQLR